MGCRASGAPTAGRGRQDRDADCKPSPSGLGLRLAPGPPGLDGIQAGAFLAGVCELKRNRRSLHYAPPDFLLNLVAMVNFMRLSLRESRIRGGWECHEAGNLGTLRSELVTSLIWPVVCGWKGRKGICQQTSPGFPRLCSGQALRLRAMSRPLCDRSARRFAQDDGLVGGEIYQRHQVQQEIWGSVVERSAVSFRLFLFLQAAVHDHGVDCPVRVDVDPGVQCRGGRVVAAG
jgi:hypothetical protein